MEQRQRRKGIVIMGRLIGLVRPLLPFMCLAVLMGVLGYLCAIFLTIIAGYGILHGLMGIAGTDAEALSSGITALAVVLVTLAVLRGILHYGE